MQTKTSMGRSHNCEDFLCSLIEREVNDVNA